MRRLSMLFLAAVLTAGCTGEPWQTRDISGLMPPLEFELSAPDGGTLAGRELRGRAVLMVFGYASCPDVCPTTLARLSALLRRLPPGRREQVQILFVSVDPQRDTPARLRAFTGHFGPGIIGATGRPEQLRALARRYRTTFVQGPAGPDGFYEVTHSSGVYVFDRDGEARLLFRPGDSPEAMLADLRRMLR